jgi:hypothetical protein
MRAWGNLIDLVLASLRDDGPATRAQLENRLRMDSRNVGQTVARIVRIMDRPRELRGRRRAHICGWIRDEHEGKRSYPRPIYAFGHGANAPKPKPQTEKQIKARQWLKAKAKHEDSPAA